MINSVRCIHCGSRTKLNYQPVRSEHHGSTIILNNAPMHFCSNCEENLISLEALTAFRYIKRLPLNQGINEFDFADIYSKANKAAM